MNILTNSLERFPPIKKKLLLIKNVNILINSYLEDLLQKYTISLKICLKSLEELKQNPFIDIKSYNDIEEYLFKNK